MQANVPDLEHRNVAGLRMGCFDDCQVSTCLKKCHSKTPFSHTSLSLYLPSCTPSRALRHRRSLHHLGGKGRGAGTEATMTSPPPPTGWRPRGLRRCSCVWLREVRPLTRGHTATRPSLPGSRCPPAGASSGTPMAQGTQPRKAESHEEVACATALGGADRPAGKPPWAWRGRGGCPAPAATSRWPSPAEGVRAETPSQPCRVLLQLRTRPAQALDLSVSQSAVTDHQGSRPV